MAIESDNCPNCGWYPPSGKDYHPSKKYPNAIYPCHHTEFGIDYETHCCPNCEILFKRTCIRQPRMEQWSPYRRNI